MSDGWCEKYKECGNPSLKNKDGSYTYLCTKHTLDKAEKDRLDLLYVVNQPGITWKTRRALLRTKFGLADLLIDELIGKDEPASDY